jgi:hypothetical protein
MKQSMPGQLLMAQHFDIIQFLSVFLHSNMIHVKYSQRALPSLCLESRISLQSAKKNANDMMTMKVMKIVSNSQRNETSYCE